MIAINFLTRWQATALESNNKVFPLRSQSLNTRTLILSCSNWGNGLEKEEKKNAKLSFLPFSNFPLPYSESCLLATILVTNRWNRHCFSRIFRKNHEIYTSYCFPPWNVPSPSPMLSHAYFESLRPLRYPNQHWGRGNRHKCFKIFDEYCSKALLHESIVYKPMASI